MQHYRTISSPESVNGARAAIEQHLIRTGYRRQSTDPDLVYRRASGPGLGLLRRLAVPGRSTSAWPATLTARVNPGSEGTSSIFLSLDADPEGQSAGGAPRGSAAGSAAEAELDALVVAVRGTVVRRGVVAAAAPHAPAQAGPGARAGLPGALPAALRIKMAANWFFFIGGLSLLNSLLVVMGVKGSFPVGLGATQIVDNLALLAAAQLGSNAVPVLGILAFAADAVLAGLFVFFGLAARRGRRWAFTVGMILYALDALLFFAVPDYLSIAFHGFALVGLLSGWRASREAGRPDTPAQTRK